jgi:flavin reductase (DIM6/NTAB) family NADH-FMN oxidoreductase RutF
MRFASRVEDRFADLALDIGLGGVPLISGSLATLQCRTHQRVAAGDHIIMIGWVEALSEADGEQAALGYHRSQFVPVG